MPCYVEISIAEVTAPQVKAAHEYWEKARGIRLMPARGDIDPIDLRFCLGWACLIDVLEEPVRRFKYRIDGSRLADLTGWDLTGRYLDDMKDETYRNLVLAIYTRVVESKAPLFVRNSEEWTDIGYVTESVTLPLSDDGERVTGLLDVIIPKWRSAAGNVSPGTRSLAG